LFCFWNGDFQLGYWISSFWFQHYNIHRKLIKIWDITLCLSLMWCCLSVKSFDLKTIKTYNFIKIWLFQFFITIQIMGRLLCGGCPFYFALVDKILRPTRNKLLMLGTPFITNDISRFWFINSWPIKKSLKTSTPKHNIPALNRLFDITYNFFQTVVNGENEGYIYSACLNPISYFSDCLEWNNWQDCISNTYSLRAHQLDSSTRYSDHPHFHYSLLFEEYGRWFAFKCQIDLK
jgi:hypothetical protein